MDEFIHKTRFDSKTFYSNDVFGADEDFSSYSQNNIELKVVIATCHLNL